MDTFANLEPMLKVFWFIAIPISLIFLIQTIMTFVGTDSADGLDADFDSNLDGGDTPFQLFSFRNMINFLLGFSWSGISFYAVITNKILLVIIAFAIGTVFLLLFFFIIRQLQKLAENNSFRIVDTVGKTAEVYLAIPENKTGKGKIMISVKGTFHELDAMTDNSRIPSGAAVKVVRVENNIPIVEPF